MSVADRVVEAEGEHERYRYKVDAMLAQELSRVFINLVSSQRELDRDAKRALYGNLRRLYCR